jgi:lysozyme
VKQLVKLIQTFEGLRLEAYKCPAGIWTIGYGSTGADIVSGLVWTQEKAQERMMQEASSLYGRVRKIAPEAPEAALCAFADFAYNLGFSRLAGSTMLRKYNSGNVAAAKLECEKWVWCGARVLPGLVLRRKAEAALL